jgi:FO synthase
MLSTDEAYRLTRFSFSDLAPAASEIRDDFVGDTITYSPKVFLPLTYLCRDTCSYCTFAKSPSAISEAYMSIADILDVCAQGRDRRCSEALFTLGESPELRHDMARQWLDASGYSSTIDYLTTAARAALREGRLLPHVNPGAISDRDMLRLKEVSVSQGMMLESIAGRLCEPGGPHFGSPDKTPARRLATLEAAGRTRVPFTTGLLVGIGDTKLERIEGMLAIRDLHQRFGHIQEVIIQNFLPKPTTGMASAPACDEDEHLWTIAAARMIFEDTTHIQAPPNLAHSIDHLIDAGIDDLGGISPVTIDFVNPEKPWPHLDAIAASLSAHNKHLRARAAIYPEYISKLGFGVDDNVVPYLSSHVDSEGYLKQSPQLVDLTTEKPPPRRGSNLPAIRPVH